MIMMAQATVGVPSLASMGATSEDDPDGRITHPALSSIMSMTSMISTGGPRGSTPPVWAWIIAWCVSTLGAALAFYAVGLVIF